MSICSTQHSRLLAVAFAILETYQTADGVRVPEALVPFMGGTTFLPFVRGPREDLCDKIP